MTGAAAQPQRGRTQPPRGSKLCIRGRFHQRTLSDESVLFRQNKCLPFGRRGRASRCFRERSHRQTGSQPFALSSLPASPTPAPPRAAWRKRFHKPSSGERAQTLEQSARPGRSGGWTSSAVFLETCCVPTGSGGSVVEPSTTSSHLYPVKCLSWCPCMSGV